MEAYRPNLHKSPNPPKWIRTHNELGVDGAELGVPGHFGDAHILDALVLLDLLAVHLSWTGNGSIYADIW